MTFPGDGIPKNQERSADSQSILQDSSPAGESSGPFMDLGLTTSAELSRDGYGVRSSRRARRTRLGLILVTIQFLAFIGGIAWLVRDRPDAGFPAGEAVSASATAEETSGDDDRSGIADSPSGATESDVQTDTFSSDAEGPEDLDGPAGPDGQDPGVAAADEINSELPDEGGQQSGDSDLDADTRPTDSTRPVDNTEPGRATTTTVQSKTPVESTSIENGGGPSSTAATVPDSDPGESSEVPRSTLQTPTTAVSDATEPISIGIDVVYPDGTAIGLVKVTLKPGSPGPADKRERSGFSDDGRIELDVIHGCYQVKLGSASANRYDSLPQRRCFKSVGQRHLVTVVLVDRVEGHGQPDACSMHQKDDQTWVLTVSHQPRAFALRYDVENESGDAWTLQKDPPVSRSDTTVVYEIPGQWYSTTPDEQLKVSGYNGRGSRSPVVCEAG